MIYSEAVEAKHKNGRASSVGLVKFYDVFNLILM